LGEICIGVLVRLSFGSKLTTLLQGLSTLIYFNTY